MVVWIYKIICCLKVNDRPWQMTYLITDMIYSNLLENGPSVSSGRGDRFRTRGQRLESLHWQQFHLQLTVLENREMKTNRPGIESLNKWLTLKSHEFQSFGSWKNHNWFTLATDVTLHPWYYFSVPRENLNIRHFDSFMWPRESSDRLVRPRDSCDSFVQLVTVSCGHVTVLTVSCGHVTVVTGSWGYMTVVTHLWGHVTVVTVLCVHVTVIWQLWQLLLPRNSYDSFVRFGTVWCGHVTILTVFFCDQLTVVTVLWCLVIAFFNFELFPSHFSLFCLRLLAKVGIEHISSKWGG